MADSLSPEPESLSPVEVADLLRSAGADPEQLATRMRAALSTAGAPVAASTAPQPASPERPLDSCGAFQGLFEAERAHTLSTPRRMLLEDHLHSCPECRRAHERFGFPATTGPRMMPAPVAVMPVTTQLGRRRTISVWTAVAAVVLLAFAIGLIGGLNGVLPGQGSNRGTVESVTGKLFTAGGHGVRPVSAGYVLGGEDIRTGTASRALVRLRDGSLVEMGERAGMIVTAGWSGATVHLDSGPVIVQAAKQTWGRHLFVSTSDSRVAVKGTIFSVNSSLRGSRVAVIEGRVEVERRGRSVTLTAGQEDTSTTAMAQVPISSEISWSANSAQYLALLGEAAKIQAQLNAVPAPALRYQSNLLPYVPANAILYVALPNLSDTLSQATQIFQTELQQSPVLQSWWSAQPSSTTNGFQNALARIQSVSSFLGNEVVIAVPPGAPNASPILLAQVTQAGLADYLRSQLPASGSGVQVVTDPSALVSAGRGMTFLIANNLLAASPNAAELQGEALLLAQPNLGSFNQSGLYQQIAPLYQQGAGWIFAADLGAITAGSPYPARMGAATGISSAKYLIAEHRQSGAGTENEMTLTFSGGRQGIFSFLGAPGPMGTLDFVSPNATFAASVLTVSPATILQQVLQQVTSSQANAGVATMFTNFANNVASALGGEATFAMDGPLVPTPSWKLILQVNDSNTLQTTISALAMMANATISQQQTNGQIIYTLTSTQVPGRELDYAFVDSYWVAAPSAALITDAIQDRLNQNTLPRSPAFQSQLPADGYNNFSALVYHNIGSQAGALSQVLSGMGVMSQAQQQSLASFASNDTPGLIYAYGQPNGIVVGSTSGFLGLNLQSLMALAARWNLSGSNP